jgi:mannose-1-phosphate guanylyltransferase
MQAELNRHAPAIARAAEAALDRGAYAGGAFILDPDEFAAAPADSIDYAVMEKTARARLAGPLDVGWSDVGSWSALPPGDHGGVSLDCAGNLLVSDGPFIAALGVDDLVIVATGDAVLVAPRARAEEVKKIVAELSARGRQDLL